jgi:hypothetical protein
MVYYVVIVPLSLIVLTYLPWQAYVVTVCSRSVSKFALDQVNEA